MLQIFFHKHCTCSKHFLVYLFANVAKFSLATIAASLLTKSSLKKTLAHKNVIDKNFGAPLN
jgi:arsenate reductase-like glutaredoxin family protein